jgi:hypothetical protein
MSMISTIKMSREVSRSLIHFRLGNTRPCRKGSFVPQSVRYARASLVTCMENGTLGYRIKEIYYDSTGVLTSISSWYVRVRKAVANGG